jgi:DNA-binding XRE family transcriptional regulator
MKFRDDLQEQLKDPEFAKAYKEMESEYEIVRHLIVGRAEKNLTQAELANRTGIPQAHISRIENANYNPSLAYLKRLAVGLGKELHVEFR